MTVALSVGGVGPLEMVVPVAMVAVVLGVVYAVANRAVSSSLPGYSVDAERVGGDEVEVTVTGLGTASKIQLVVDGEVRGEVDAEPDARATVEVDGDEELSVRKLGGT